MTLTEQESAARHRTAAELRNLPATQRDAILAVAAESAERDYQHEKKLTDFEAYGINGDLIGPLVEWCESRSDRVAACYIMPPRDGAVPIFVVGSRERYDFGLRREISELAMRFHGANFPLPVMAVQVTACDSEELRAYFDPARALQVYG